MNATKNKMVTIKLGFDTASKRSLAAELSTEIAYLMQARALIN